MARWTVEQVEAIAPTPAAVTAARPLVTSTRWDAAGADDRVLWGVCRGSGAEPYDTMVDHVTVGFSCTCPSRRSPCKHALGLLLLWVQGQVPDAVAPPSVGRWITRRAERAGPMSDTSDGTGTAGGDDASTTPTPSRCP